MDLFVFQKKYFDLDTIIIDGNHGTIVSLPAPENQQHRNKCKC
jgi:hypothetical protein